jgi:hypothetical protein
MGITGNNEAYRGNVKGGGTFEFDVATVPNWWNRLTDEEKYQVWHREITRERDEAIAKRRIERGSVLNAVSAPQTQEPTMPIEFELQVVKDGKVESVPLKFFPDSGPPLVKAIRERDEARATVMRTRLPEDTIKTLAQEWLAERNPEQGWPSRIERFNAAYYSENNEVVTRLLVDFYNYAEGKAESPIPPK